MRYLFTFGLFVACSASAQVVSVKCPESYPPKAAMLEVAPAGHQGRGLVPANNPLEHWNVFDGEFTEPAQMHIPASAKVPGGSDTVVPPVRWFVCYYRGGISWWEDVGADKAEEKELLKNGCVVQSRDKGRSIKLVCK